MKQDDFDITITTEVNDNDLHSLYEMLVDAFEGDFSEEDFLHTYGGIRILGILNTRVIAHAALIPRNMLIDHQETIVGYVEGFAVASQYQGQGFGKRLIKTVTELCLDNYTVSMLSTGEHDFYRAFGWMDFQGKSYVIEDGVKIRSAEEDSGLMIRSEEPGKYLQAEISCFARPGDAW